MNESGSGKVDSAPLINKKKDLGQTNNLMPWNISSLVDWHLPGWISWKAGLQGPCDHHARWKEGLCDGPWWGNTCPEWPRGQFQSHRLQPDNRVIKLAMNQCKSSHAPLVLEMSMHYRTYLASAQTYPLIPQEFLDQALFSSARKDFLERSQFLFLESSVE